MVDIYFDLHEISWRFFTALLTPSYNKNYVYCIDMIFALQTILHPTNMYPNLTKDN